MPKNVQKYSMLRVAVGVALLLACFSTTVVEHRSVSGSTIVSGQILTDTTWTVANSPYVVSESVLVSENVTLTIEPAVIVEFGQGKVLRVEGRLTGLGADGAQIVFTSNQATPSPGDWGGLQFTASSGGNILQHCIVEYAGWNGLAALLVQDQSANIDRCVIRENGSFGLRIEGPFATVTNSTICANGGNGLYISASSVSVSNNVIYGNNAARGGGIYLAAASGVIAANEIRDNRVSGDGGGVYVSGTLATISGNVIGGNTASGDGGGIRFEGTLGKVTANVIKSNTTTGDGAGIYFKGTSGSITANVIEGNMASGNGAGVYLSGGYNLFSSNTVSSNSATAYGGGLCVLCGNCVSANTIQTNHTGMDGGGVCLVSTSSCKGQTTIIANSIAGNDSTGKGGGLSSIGDPRFWDNNLVGNSPFDLAVRDAYGTEHVGCANNWWGVCDGAVIQTHIWDWSDSLNLAVVDVWPWKESPVTVDVANHTPDQPVGVEAPLLDRDLATLTSSEFSDPDSFDLHIASEWQVTANSGDYSSLLFDSGVNWNALLAIRVGAGKLAYSTTYFWHVRYMDSRGAWSEYSSELSFTTTENPKAKKSKGETGACACTQAGGNTSTVGLLAPWGVLGLCTTAGLYLARRLRKR